MKYYLESNDLYIEIPTLVFNQIKLQAEGEYPKRDNPGFLGPVFRHSQNQHLEKFDGIQYIRFTGSVGTVDDSHFQQSYPVLNFIRILIRHKSICRWLKTDFLNRFNGEKIFNAELCYHNY